MKLPYACLALLVYGQFAVAETCHERFSALLINGNEGFGPTRMHITQEIVGNNTSITYHYDQGDGNGMGEAVEPPTNPWTLFYNDKMYMSHDKGATWSFVTDFDSAKGRADNKAALRKDMQTARDLKCDTDALDGIEHDVLEGRYTSSVIAGAEIFEKLWVSQDTGMIKQSYRHVTSTGFETKTTQIVSLYPELVLPDPE